jgi:hypothetical protein
MNITQPPTNTTAYQKSYFPQTIKDWNSLPLNIRNSPSIATFKENMKKTLGPKANPLFKYNSSKTSINHTRIRLGLSGLASQRCDYNHIKDPKCQTCGAKTEDPQHFFLTCPTYNGFRPIFLQKISDILTANNIQIEFHKRHFRDFFLNIILNGSPLLDEQANMKIIEVCQSFIRESKRFL